MASCRGISDDHRRAIRTHQQADVGWAAGIATSETMTAHFPDVAWLGDRIGRKSRDIVGRIVFAINVIRDQRIDFPRLKTREVGAEPSFRQ